jgi:NAD+ synthase (glutamine-hydrolysing)
MFRACEITDRARRTSVRSTTRCLERHDPVRIALGQVATRVGDIDGNVEVILDAWHRAAAQGADLVVFPELAVTGYPPEDLLLKPEFLAATDAALERLITNGPTGTVAVVGTVGTAGERHQEETWDVSVPALDLRNRAVVLDDGQVAATYDKWRLPNYGVFDEARYFVPRNQPCVVRVAGVDIGVVICEDLWSDHGPVTHAVQSGARGIVVLNASPWHVGKRAGREQWVRDHATTHGVWMAYVNVVGGQDDVVFDGDSFLTDATGTVISRGPQFAEDLVVVDLDEPAPTLAPPLEPAAEVWQALVLATRDYVRRNGFDQVIVALSGGIDSAIVGAIAADALGGDHVIGLLLPSPWSSDHSLTDARLLADNLGIRTHEVPIAPAMNAFGDMFADMFAAEGSPPTPDGHVSLTEENIQSRIRGLTVMAVSNETGALVLTTGNKSEYAVGYATLYGDMNGGFGPIKDVPKTMVYDLARYRASVGPSIPENTIAKPPSAELKPGQTDQDSLPPYEVLDDIIARYVEHDQGIADIVAAGHDEMVVRDILRRIDGSEFKRRQAAPGPKVTVRAFGKERRVPITHHWRG